MKIALKAALAAALISTAGVARAQYLLSHVTAGMQNIVVDAAFHGTADPMTVQATGGGPGVQYPTIVWSCAEGCALDSSGSTEKSLMGDGQGFSTLSGVTVTGNSLVKITATFDDKHTTVGNPHTVSFSLYLAQRILPPPPTPLPPPTPGPAPSQVATTVLPASPTAAPPVSAPAPAPKPAPAPAPAPGKNLTQSFLPKTEKLAHRVSDSHLSNADKAALTAKILTFRNSLASTTQEKADAAFAQLTAELDKAVDLADVRFRLTQKIGKLRARLEASKAAAADKAKLAERLDKLEKKLDEKAADVLAQLDDDVNDAIERASGKIKP